jgi:superfamily II DNA or RNA helicase
MKKFFLFILFLQTAFLFPQEGAGVELKEYQLYPADFLASRPNQKGLLIYHGLGTGKTYLSLGFAERYQDKKIIVLLPRFLKSNWEIQMKSYGVKDKSRYKLVSFQDAGELLNYDFTNTIVVIDEVHKLIDLMTNSKKITDQDYGKLYFKLKSSYKILALTGTPIYNNSFDIAYLANLVAGENLITMNPETFKENYTKINTPVSLFRGYFTESKLILSLFPFTMGISTFPLAFAGGALAIVPLLAFFTPFLTIFITNAAVNAGSANFRRFNPKELQTFTQNYVSFHEVELESKELYPSSKIYRKKVNYNPTQVNMFLEFVDEALGMESLRVLMLDSEVETLSREDLELNSFNLQKKFLQDPTFGRDIGNLALFESTDPEEKEKGLYTPYRIDDKIVKKPKMQLVESEKFEQLYSIIKSKQGQVAIYSNYYSNGILQLAHFFERKGFKDFKILSPEQSVEEQIDTINAYNEAKMRVLLIHPEITEGVSLKATEQLHILEPLTNLALQEQVIGRAVRLNSHERLPKNRNHVDVYIWESVIKYCHFKFIGCIVPSSASYIKQEHWQRRYSEINPSDWTHGISFVDKNYIRKDQSPDSRVAKTSNVVAREMKAFKDLIRKHSIESLKNKKIEPIAMNSNLRK